ncbi:hypothetical protein R3P38DRAFT_2762279 [Favolaschia claudopus]|uniref:Uncharacterized protein n=1 Tax=Favolaschia claudopus TaxID=2862362 RepID=A0AAW0DL43_9AGAR
MASPRRWFPLEGDALGFLLRCRSQSRLSGSQGNTTRMLFTVGDGASKIVVTSVNSSALDVNKPSRCRRASANFLCAVHESELTNAGNNNPAPRPSHPRTRSLVVQRRDVAWLSFFLSMWWAAGPMSRKTIRGRGGRDVDWPVYAVGNLRLGAGGTAMGGSWRLCVDEMNDLWDRSKLFLRPVFVRVVRGAIVSDGHDDGGGDECGDVSWDDDDKLALERPLVRGTEEGGWGAAVSAGGKGCTDVVNNEEMCACIQSRVGEEERSGDDDTVVASGGADRRLRGVVGWKREDHGGLGTSVGRGGVDQEEAEGMEEEEREGGAGGRTDFVQLAAAHGDVVQSVSSMPNSVDHLHFPRDAEWGADGADDDGADEEDEEKWENTRWRDRMRLSDIDICVPRRERRSVSHALDRLRDSYSARVPRSCFRPDPDQEQLLRWPLSPKNRPDIEGGEVMRDGVSFFPY